jgi:hypothetical protein
MKIIFLGRLLALGVVLVTTGQLASGNLITNPGFETGDFSGWTASGSAVFVQPGEQHSGTYSANFESSGPNLDTVSQNLATTSSSLYDLSFWLFNAVVGGPPINNEFRVTFGGVVILDLLNAPGFSYTQFTFTGLAATGSSTTLEFAGKSGDGGYFLDDISVTAGAAANVPDAGSSALLLGLGLAGVVFLQRRLC